MRTARQPQENSHFNPVDAASSRSEECRRMSNRSRPTNERDVVLYIREGCHLCGEALAVLHRHGLKPRIVDIDSDAELTTRYDLCVPVVWVDGRERFRGRVNEVLLRRILDRD